MIFTAIKIQFLVFFSKNSGKPVRDFSQTIYIKHENKHGANATEGSKSCKIILQYLSENGSMLERNSYDD